MSKNKKNIIAVQGASVTVLSQNQQDIICLTDIAKFKNPEHSDDVIRNWLRTKNHRGGLKADRCSPSLLPSSARSSVPPCGR